MTSNLLEIKRRRIELLLQKKILQARKNFFDFCNTLHPDFYKRDRTYLVELCDTLQALYEKRIVRDDDGFHILPCGESASIQQVVSKLMINVPPQFGKAIEDNTPVLTSKGWKNHGDLQIGDYVFNQKGKPVKVLNVQKSIMQECVKLTFDTKESIICSKQHEWVIEANRGKKTKSIRVGRETEILEAQNIFNGYHAKSPAVKVCEPLQNDKMDLPIDPYLLGVWLGDGTNKDTTISIGDRDYIAITNELVKRGIIFNINKSSKGSTLINVGVTTGKINSNTFRNGLKSFDLLNNKHIPYIYLLSSFGQRWELLKGLMDTDGTVSKNGCNCAYDSINLNLANNVFQLVRSLGFKCSLTIKDAKIYGRFISKSYRVVFTPIKGQQIFYTKFKQQRVDNKLKIDRNDKFLHFIKSVNNVGQYKAKCITVDGGIYLVGNGLIPTHNSRTLISFTAWCLGQNNKERVLTVSYNQDTASDFSRYTRDTIALEQPDKYDISYVDIFPETKLKMGNASFLKWAVDGSHFSYLGTGIDGSVTSKSGTIRIIDDPIKNAKEAFNSNTLDDIWRFYTSTFMSRQSGECIDIINHTRWSDDDLCGRLLKRQKDEWYIFKKEAYDKDTDEMLCDELLSKKNYENIKSLCDPLIFSANYHQTVIDASTKLYTKLQTYSQLPASYTSITACVDTADTGDDWLCAIIALIYDMQCYVLDVYYTKDPMEVTEIELSRRLSNLNVNICHIESNNGGRGFGRAVKRILKETYRNNSVIIKLFHQSDNKMSRILSNSTNVMQNVFFPENWNIRFPDFYRDMNKFSTIGKNKDLDCADCSTMLVEKVCKNYDSVRLLK